MSKYPATKLLDEVGKYLKSEGWQIGVLGPLKIEKAGDRAFQYDMIIQLSVKPPEKASK